jgi:hypothetical protein
MCRIEPRRYKEMAQKQKIFMLALMMVLLLSAGM